MRLCCDQLVIPVREKKSISRFTGSNANQSKPHFSVGMQCTDRIHGRGLAGVCARVLIHGSDPWSGSLSPVAGFAPPGGKVDLSIKALDFGKEAEEEQPDESWMEAGRAPFLVRVGLFWFIISKGHLYV